MQNIVITIHDDHSIGAVVTDTDGRKFGFTLKSRKLENLAARLYADIEQIKAAEPLNAQRSPGERLRDAINPTGI